MHIKMLITVSASLLAVSCHSAQDSSFLQSSPEVVQGTWALPIQQSGGVVQQEGSQLKLLLQVEDYETSSFERYGYWDGSGEFEHAYGGDSQGSFSYVFRGPSQPLKNLAVQVRLSAESSTQGKPDETSDVELLINGHSLGQQTVMADDGKGRIYSWKLADSSKVRALRIVPERANELRFVVGAKARHKNGICIYGRSLIPGHASEGQPIVLAFDTSPSSDQERR